MAETTPTPSTLAAPGPSQLTAPKTLGGGEISVPDSALKPAPVDGLTRIVPEKITGSIRHDVRYAIVFKLLGEPYVSHGVASGSMRGFIAATIKYLERNPDVEYDLHEGVGLFFATTEAEYEHIIALTQKIRDMKAERGVASPQEMAEDFAERIMSQPWLVPGSKVQPPAPAAPAENSDDHAE